MFAMKTKYLLLFSVLLLSGFSFSQILNSNASITNKVVYLDFDGQYVSGTSWNSGNPINALPSSFSAANINIIWQRVSEDYRPFDVNITTDSLRFNNAQPNRRMRVVITPTSAWYGTSAGGVAYVGSFAWGGTPGTPCWIFENMLSYSAKNVAEAISHEVGHTLSLRHQSTYNSTCTKTAEYNPGQGTGVTSWAPIMGVGYSKNVTTWFTGTSSNGCTLIQYDHSNGSPGITGSSFLSFLPDDVGDTYANAKIINLTSLTVQDSGIITTPADIDTYAFTICNNRNVSFSVKPWALDTINYQGANLDVRFQLYNAAGLLLLTDTSLTRLHTLAGINLTAGSYYFTVDGGRSNNYSDYGSLGKYYIRIKATNPPVLANTIVTSPGICLGQNTTFSYTSNGTPTLWQWSVSGPSTTVTSTLQNPAITFTAVGTYTLSLLATSTTSTSCETSRTIVVNASPTLSVPSNTIICLGTNLQLAASGASTYIWQPGNFSGDTQVMSPTVTTAYTVTGNNNLCSSSAIITVSVIPSFTLNAVTSGSLICSAESVTITASGATSYTFNPGAITGSQVVVSPSVTTNYIILASNGACTKSISKLITVSPLFDVFVTPSDTTFCAGETVSLTASGASSYTFNPGGITGSTAVVSPLSSVTYTITGANADNCLENVTADLSVAVCEYTGINERHGDNNFMIYPNPALGDITITPTAGCSKIEIINALGSLIFQKNISDNQMTAVGTGNWANGIYFVKVYFKSGEPSVQKLIIRN